MPKVSRKISTLLSLIIAFTLLAVCIAGLIGIYPLTEVLIDTPDNIGNRGDITPFERIIVHIAAYGIVITCTGADILLIKILLRVRKGLVFSDKTVSHFRWMSWSCFFLCLFFGVLGLWFQLAHPISFLCACAWLFLRVIKNTVEEATYIKQENDLTV